MAAPYLITGADTYGDVHPRLDICDLQADHPEQFTLFILSWKEIRKPGYQPQAAQFAQIGGIHGMPYARWPGDPDQSPQSVRGTWLGYCNHGSIMFPNWHRPYLLLLEQAICEVAHGIAGKFASQVPSEATQWISAARELRLPFWDWTHSRTNTQGLPEVLTTPKLELKMPGGGKKTHENILSYYEFHQPIDGFNNRLEYKSIYDAKADPPRAPDTMAYFKEWNRTYRCPNSSPVEVNDNIAQVNNTLMGKNVPRDEKTPKYPIGSWANLTAQVQSTFTFPMDLSKDLYANAWDEFSNTRFQSGHRDPNRPKEVTSPYHWNTASLEQPHNYVHLVVGGIGHMGDNDTAGFDPIFYLHHCNVDRLLSFWEQIYPNYVAGEEGFLDEDGKTKVPFTQKYGTYIETAQEEVDEDTPLMPFRKSNYTYWSSADTHSLQHTPKEDEDLVRKRASITAIMSVLAHTTDLDYTYPAINGVQLDLGPPLSREERNKQREKLVEYFTVYDTNEHVQKEYLLTVSLSETYFTGSYMLNVCIQIGQAQLEIGAVAVLGRGNSAGCGNCRGRREAGARVRGVIPIPADAVHDLVQANVTMPPPTDETIKQTTERDVNTEEALLRTHFRPHLVLPSGKPLSWPSGHAPALFTQTKSFDGKNVSLSPLPEQAIPEIRLTSRLRHIPFSNLPIGGHDLGWKDHGSLSLGSWVEAS
ncbi:hypothetical protein FRC12_008387 [Ceratobasidium sp. 428]|nr:hypothetical protein FRC12_008387 [Ceratobasidium sp. 428]